MSNTGLFQILNLLKLAKGEAMKKKKNKNTCKKIEPQTIYGAACEIVNAVIEEANKFVGLGFVKEKILVALSDREYISSLVNSSYGTIDGESDDLVMLINLSKYIVDYHIERNELHNIEFIKVKEFEDGQNGWTSVHYPT